MNTQLNDMSLSLDMLPVIVRDLKQRKIGLNTALRFVEKNSQIIKDQELSILLRRRALKKGPISRRRFLKQSHLLDLESLQLESLNNAMACLRTHSRKTSAKKLEESLSHYESAQTYFHYQVKERLQPLLRDQFDDHFAA